MALGGAGAILKVRAGDLEPGTEIGDQAGLDAAKVYAAFLGGAVHMGPGIEALILGAFAANVCLVRYTNLGEIFLSRLRITDGADPTKALALDLSAIGTGLTRTAIVRNHGGYLLLPAAEGAAGQFLRSQGAGAQPDWAAVSVSNALLDGVNHTDTIAKAVAAGMLPFGNATPKWDGLPIGAAGEVLTVVGGLPAWSGSPGAVLHNTLSHIQPFSAANCNWTGSVTRITTSGNAFANVKVGDFVYVGAGLATVGNQGRRVASWTDANTIDVDVAKTGSDLAAGTIIFVPGDHWNDTLAPDSFGAGVGYMLASGRGTFSQTGPGTTFQELRGPIRWMGHANGSDATDFRVQGSTSAGSPFGFGIWKSTTVGVWFMVNNLTASRVLTVPDVSDEIALIGAPQTITNKTFTTGNAIRMDETGATTNGCAFRDRAGTTKGLGFDLTDITAGTNKVAKWKDVSAGGYVEFDYTARVTAIDGKTVATTNLFTVPAGKSFIVTRCIVRVTAATAITVGPTLGIGVAAGEDDIVASTALTTMIATDTFTLMLPKTGAVVALAAQVIKLGIDVGATGTSMTLAVDLAGYLV